MDRIAVLPELIYQKSRLKILLFVRRHGTSRFKTIREATGLSEANLSAHIGKLEESGLVKIEKFFEGKKPVTAVCLTNEGERRLQVFFNELWETERLSRLPGKEVS